MDLIVVVGILLMFTAILVMILLVMDNALLPVKHQEGRIIDKRFVPEHKEWVLTSYDCETYFNQLQHFPDAWQILVEIPNGKCWASIKKEVYDACLLGMTVAIEYQQRRVSKSFVSFEAKEIKQ